MDKEYLFAPYYEILYVKIHYALLHFTLLLSAFVLARSSVDSVELSFELFLLITNLLSVTINGFFALSSTGKNTRAWYSPKITLRKNTLKKVINACDFESHRRTTAKNVVMPPFNTAGPILCNAFWDLSKREPKQQ